MNNEVRFIDTTVRDGNQSLWALNMKIGAMLPALPHMDEAGFESMEFFLSVIFKKYVREHKENPWFWLKEGTKRIKKTRLRYHGGMHSAFEKTPHVILKLLIERLVSYGLTLTRTSNCWNDYDAFGEEIADLKKHGMDTVANLILFGLAAPHRRILRQESQGSRGGSSMADLLQRCRRPAHPRPGAHADPGGLESRRRYPRGVSRPL